MRTQSRLIAPILLFLFTGCSFFLQAQISHNSQWSWRNGNTSNSMVRGPQGKASTFYTPGYRESAVQFVDKSGNLWLYGGAFSGKTYGDLWFFNISTDEWTWVGGTTDMDAAPVYGSFRSGTFQTFPGSRHGSFSWFDPKNGKLWLFGGVGYAAGNAVGFRDDMWSYDLGSGIWTWMSGSQSLNATRYGTRLSDPANTPGARTVGGSWYVDNSLNPYQPFTSVPQPARPCAKLYLAFGFGSGIGRTDDVWVYNTDDNNWMFLSDVPVVVNGTQSAPFRREGVATWSRLEYTGDNIQNRDFLYAYGGYGADRTGIEGYLADLWKFDVLTNKWIYVEGSQYINPPVNNTRPGPNWQRKAAIRQFGEKVYLFGLENNDVWEYNYSNGQWNKFSAGGAVNFGVQTGQGPDVRPGRGFASNVWFFENRLYVFATGSVFCYFDPCTSNTISASQSSVNDPSDSVTFTCTAVGAGPATYLWRNKNAVASLVNSPTFTTANIKPGDVYSCFVTNTAGCANNIRLVSYSNNISITCTPPVNDDACNALALTLNAQPLYGNNDYATATSEAAGTCYQASNTVWYKYTPSTSGHVQFMLGAGLSGDTLNSWISVFTATGNCPSLSLVDSTATIFGGCRYYHAPANKNATVWTSFLQAGKTYYFRLSGLHGDVGRYALSIRSADAVTTKSGRWYDPEVWSSNSVPTDQSFVTVTQPLVVDSNAYCKALNVENGVTITVQDGKTLSVLSDPPNPQGAALSFDGVNDYIFVPHNAFLKPPTGITIEAWIKPVDIHTPAFAEIYRKEDGNDRQLFSFQNNGTILSLGLNIGGVYSELDVPINRLDYEGQWVHVAATFDGTTKRIFRNGALIGAQYAPGLMSTAGTAPGCIGSLGGYAEFFNGSIDEFRLWNRAISVGDNLSCELTKPQTGLLLYYKFNQGLAGAPNTGVNRVLDFSDNNWGGFLLNFTLNGSLSNWTAPGAVQTGFSCIPVQ